jgi:hypothetical protein
MTRNTKSHTGDPDFEELVVPGSAKAGKVPATARLQPQAHVTRLFLSAADAARAFGNSVGDDLVQGNGERGAGDTEATVARAANSSGAALPRDVRTKFESSLAVDLCGVRLQAPQDL